MDKVILFSKNGCPQCMATKMALRQNGIEFEERNVEENEEYLKEVKEVYGVSSMPLVVTPDGDTWTGFQPKKIMSLKD